VLLINRVKLNIAHPVLSKLYHHLSLEATTQVEKFQDEAELLYKDCNPTQSDETRDNTATFSVIVK
jgi:hypothetical protein